MYLFFCSRYVADNPEVGGALKTAGSKEKFDPFKERHVEHPTT
jgi:hypothetical protein